MRVSSILILDAVMLLILIVLNYLVYIANLSIGMLFQVTGAPPAPVADLGKYLYLGIYAMAAVLVIGTIYYIFTAIRGEE